MDKVIIGIYKISNKINGKVYIGESLDIEKRWAEHISSLDNNKHHSYKLQSDWARFGKDNFDFVIVEEVEKKESIYKTTMQLIYVEWKYINEYDSINNGYNVEDTMSKILAGNKVIISKNVDKPYLENLIKHEGVTTTRAERKAIRIKISNEKKLVKQKLEAEKIIQDKIDIVNTGLRTRCQLSVELMEEGYTPIISTTELYTLKISNDEYLKDGYYVNGKEYKDSKGRIYSQMMITDKGKESIIKSLKLVK